MQLQIGDHLSDLNTIQQKNKMLRLAFAISARHIYRLERDLIIDLKKLRGASQKFGTELNQTAKNYSIQRDLTRK